MGGEVDLILSLLGVSGEAPPRPPDVGGQGGTSERCRVVRRGGSVWLEVDGGGEGVLKVARGKAILLLRLMPQIDEWSRGGEPRGRRNDCEWRVTLLAGGKERLEVRKASWKPMRIGRDTAAAIVAHEGQLRTFVGLRSERPPP